MTTPILAADEKPTLPMLVRVAGQVARRLRTAGLDVDGWSLAVDVRPADGRPHLSFQIHGDGDMDRLAVASAVARALKAVFTVEEHKGFCTSIPDDYVHLRGQATRGAVVVGFVAVLFSAEACDEARALFPAPSSLAGAA